MTCAECRAALAEYREVLRLLPLGLPPTQPAPGARERILAQARAEAAATQAPRPLPVRWQRWLLPLAAVLVAMLLGAGTYAMLQRDDADAPSAAEIVEQLRVDPQAQIVPMRGTGVAPSAMGQLIMRPGDTRAGLIVSGLPRLSQQRAYQLWFTPPGGARISGGIFTVDTSGNAIVVVDAPATLGSRWTCGITEEPAGGSPRPTTAPVLTGQYDGTW